MTQGPSFVEVNICDKAYQIECAEEERSHLLRTVEYLNEQIKLVQQANPMLRQTEKLVTMTALNIASDLILTAENLTQNQKIVQKHIERIQTRLTHDAHFSYQQNEQRPAKEEGNAKEEDNQVVDKYFETAP